MKWIALEVQNGRFLYCEKGSHLCMYDDQKTFFDGIIKFIKDVDDEKILKIKISLSYALFFIDYNFIL